MNRPRLLRAALATAAASLLGAACGDTTETSASQLNIDRPTDVAFACYGGLRITNGAAATADQMVTVSAQPIGGCDTRSGPRDANNQIPVPAGQEQITGATVVPVADYYAFILQSVKGTVAIAQWDPKPSSSMQSGDVKVIDADPLTPGKNSFAVGEDPVALWTDTSGCKEIVANAGSCDLSVLDVTSALDLDPAVTIDRMAVVDASGAPMRARPAAMVGQPSEAPIGYACPATATGLAYIAYPSCHAVAAVDVSTGKIQASVTWDSAGVATLHADGALSCPDECGGAYQPSDGPRPVALDLQVDPRSKRRALVVGAENSSRVSVIELDANFLPTSQVAYPLEDKTGTLGVTAVALSPQIGMGGSTGILNDGTGPGGQAQYVYAVATDHTVRVVDVLNLNVECDTQVDPRIARADRSIKDVSCFKVGDAATPRRRPGARGPGIELVGDGVPTSVAIVRADPLDSDNRASPYPSKLIGYFALVTASNGSTFVVNIDDDDHVDLFDTSKPLGSQLPLDIAHQLRDSVPGRDLLATIPDPSADPASGKTLPICDTLGPDPDASGGNSGGPRIPASPARSVPIGQLASTKFLSLPYLHTVTCTGSDDTAPALEMAFNASVADRDASYPDLRGLRSDETFSMVWEGSLSTDTSATAVDGPAVRESQLRVDQTGMHLVDATHPYCSAGVEPYDIVQLRGCNPTNGDGDCPTGYTCYTHPDSKVTNLGACMLADEADRLADACKDYLTSLRRYTVLKSTSGALQLMPRKRALYATPLDGCHDDAQCKTIADYTARASSELSPGEDTTTDSHTWTCAVDSERAPKTGYDGQPQRTCLETCTATADCQAGTVCERGFCMEGVEPPQACVNAPQRYELRSHDAFTLTGTRTGYVHPIVADAGGNCVRDPDASPFLVGRVPLTAPACDPSTDPITGLKADGTYDANPCQYQTTQADLIPQFLAGTCTAASPASVLMERPTTGIRVRTRGFTMTMVDPTYPGDARCIGDRGGSLVNVPTVFTGVTLSFRLTAGLSPLTVPISPSYPVKVVRGPGQSAWIVDEGDFLSTTVTLPSTRGKVFRVEAASLSTISTLQ